MGKTLFISDLDGTLLNSGAKITPVTASIINNLLDAGVIISYATARSYNTAARAAGDINFKYPAVHHGGVFIQDPKSGEYFDKCVFAQDKAARLIRALQDNRLRPLVYAIIGGRERVSYIAGEETAGINFYLESRRNDRRLRPVRHYADFTGDIYEILFLGNDYDELKQLACDLNLEPYFAHHIHVDAYEYADGKNKYWLEFMRADAQKDTGVCKVRQLVGADRIVCFGDNINDMPMFGISDEAYAVANALPEAKQAATGVIGSNDQDGVARWLEQNAHRYI